MKGVQKYLDGKRVDKVPKNSKLVRVVHEEYYETEKYTKEQQIKAFKYLSQLREIRQELEERHG
jgi:hypothetical protein